MIDDSQRWYEDEEGKAGGESAVIDEGRSAGAWLG
jgi:hypothetical protein